MTPYPCALVGCGWVAGEHAAAYQRNPRTQLTAIVSSNRDHAAAKAREWGVEGVEIFTSVEVMMQQMQPQIVSITSRPDHHVEQAIVAAESGASLVLEKPLGVNREEVKRLVECVKRNQTKSVVSFVLRWNPLFSVLRSIIDAGGLGELFYGEIDYYHGIGPWYGQFEWNKTQAAGGNSLLSAGCHALDALVWFMGSPVKEVHALSVRSNAPGFAEYEYDPTLVSLLRFENGKIGKVASCIESHSPYMFPIRLFGAKGSIRDNQYYGGFMAGQTDFAAIPTILPDSGDVTHHPFQEEIDHFVQRLDAGQDSGVPIAEAAHIMEVCFAAAESAQSGQPVLL